MKIKILVVGAIKTNCYFIISGNEMIVIDPGDEAERIISEIKYIGKNLKYIIYTHYHFDHISAGNHVRKYFQTKSLIHSAEKEFLSDLEIDQYLEGGEYLKIGNETLRVFHSPGHTPGSICLLNDDFIITGDTLFKDGIGRTDLAGGSSEDIERSLEKIYRIIKPRMRIYPGHGSSFLIN